MPDKKPTLGQAIDTIIAALTNLDENERRIAISATCSHMNIMLSEKGAGSQLVMPSSSEKSSVTETLSATVREQQQQKKIDIRSLKEEKQPSSAQQMACIVAYYLQEHATDSNRKEMISTKDVEKYFKQASFKLPKNLNRILVDAKNSGYFESVGRAQYKLTPVGYNLVVHGLPSKKGT